MGEGNVYSHASVLNGGLWGLGWVELSRCGEGRAIDDRRPAEMYRILCVVAVRAGSFDLRREELVRTRASVCICVYVWK